MGNKRRRFPRKPDLTISYALQAGKLRQVFPDSKVTYNRGKSFSWVGKIQPKPICEIYTVKIKYKLKIRPEVTVIEPGLRKRNGEPIPHVFPGQKLCLFRKNILSGIQPCFLWIPLFPGLQCGFFITRSGCQPGCGVAPRKNTQETVRKKVQTYDQREVLVRPCVLFLPT